MPEYISSTETAKMVRSVLKQKFPGVKFSVRKRGSSINIDWTDGPTTKMVDAATNVFNGEGFDGTIDMRYSYTAYILADGTVVDGNCNGTTGSKGCIEPYHNELPEGAREVHFLTDFIFTNRKISDRLLESALLSYRHKWGDEKANRVTVRKDDGYGASFSCPDYYEERILWDIVRRRMIAV